MNESGPCQDAEEAVRQWRAAEDRLFPLAMVDTARYEWSVTLVGALASRLGAASDVRELLSSAATLPQALPEVAAERGVPLQGLDPDLICAAACAQRYRGLLAEEAGRRREALLASARAEGRAWVVVEEPDPAALAYGAAQWVEVHAATGTALVRSVGSDPVTGAVRYRVGLADGEAEEYADPQAWQRRCDELRAGIA